jgi:hypothetical protein
MSTPIVSFDVLRELLAAARQKDQQAAARLEQLYAPWLSGIARHHLHAAVYKSADPGDITQMVWTDFFHKVLPAKSFTSSESFEAYLRGMCVNKVKEVHRHHFDVLSSSLHAERPLPVEMQEPGPTAQQMVDEREEWEHGQESLTYDRQSPSPLRVDRPHVGPMPRGRFSVQIMFGCAVWQVH